MGVLEVSLIVEESSSSDMLENNVNSVDPVILKNLKAVGLKGPCLSFKPDDDNCNNLVIITYKWD